MNKDTLELLGDCTAGIEMALSTMDGILPSVQDQTLRRKIQDSIRTHENLREHMPKPLENRSVWTNRLKRFLR